MNDKVVEKGSKKTDGLLPLGIVKETTWELKAPADVAPPKANGIVVVGPMTCVIPSGDILTEYALAESEKLGGKSYFKFWGNPIDEVGKLIFYYYYIILIRFLIFLYIYIIWFQYR